MPQVLVRLNSLVSGGNRFCHLVIFEVLHPKRHCIDSAERAAAHDAILPAFARQNLTKKIELRCFSSHTSLMPCSF